ncbi:2'-5' RNA ligase [Paenibacillus sp. UNCCL117]|uniref:RNA 2',3'-cyclic phosphodiesterase n=1 Tax=unclassified Paenibacillus TaxID=185978 RepID=UPI000881BFA7|nr:MULTISPECIES: RNA 2',3'-cyclic phosphodiesterase [unclassified Paenibacillus]SDC93471.1 2'-5' RNA ligase [Paenibacillus sp. cl123]SFW29567.1 2'-5' RNA ligase [Paenibacillus sp. UNCCL117]
MRVFIALPLPGEISAELERWTRLHKSKLPFRKWVHPRDYHITLQFLGEAAPERVEAVQASLRSIRSEPISLALNGAGTFGSPKAPRVLWSAVSGQTDKLRTLQAEVVRAMRPHGFVPEERPYSPHITLARTFAGEGGSPGLDVLSKDLPATGWTADRCVLMQTHMGASPMYKAIGEYPFALPSV